MGNNAPFHITMHPDLPIMMTRFEEHFVFADDAMAYTTDVKNTLDSLEEPVFYLFDLTKWNVMSFDELMTAAAQAARGKSTNFHHPMNRLTLMITNDTIVRMSARGMTSAAYDNANIKVFSKVSEALEFIEAELKA